MSPTIRLSLALALAVTLTTGCKVGSNYVRPSMASPETYRDGPTLAEAASLADQPWWEVFDDPALIVLIDEALGNNLDLRIAIARIEQARGIRAQTRSPLYPQVEYNGGVSRGRNESDGTPEFNDGQTGESAALTLGAVWELDVWGRIRRADEASLARILAAEEDRRAILLTLVSDVAQAYFTLLGLDLQKEIAIRNRGTFGDTLDIFQRRAAGGVESDLPVLRARAAQSDAAAAIPRIERDIAQTENLMNVLLGRFPQHISRTRTLVEQASPPEVPVGVPSQLLERRPDIRALEAQMIAANAEIGVAIADHFPRIGLTAFLGRVSGDLSEFTSGAANAWSIGANLTGPLFQGGRLKGQLAQARAFWDEAIAQYELRTLLALREVADALIARQKLLEIEAEQEVAVTSLLDAVRVATERFTAGRAVYFEVLEAQQELFPAEQALADTRTQQLLSYVQLYEALGGGWNLPDEGWGSVSRQPDPTVVPPATHVPSTMVDVPPATTPHSQPDE